ncbi:hypothetical protein [Streptomyces sp. NPDC088794]|uniref:hypothetical protein n=1 Tax=Streptomyces sp. NPDC088794 TaxID=3365902 RepID=UPI003827F236
MTNLRTWLANRIARPQLRKRNAEIRNLDETCMRLRAERDEAQAAVARARAETARIRAITRTWEPVANLIDAALDGPIREQQERPTHPDGTPYRFHEIEAEGWGYCDGCRLWTTGTTARPHQCANTDTQEEQTAPVDWQAIAERRERELKTVGEARREAEARARAALNVIHEWQRDGESNDYLTRVHRALNPPVSGNSTSSN